MSNLSPWPRQPGRPHRRGVRAHAAAWVGIVAIAACSPDRVAAPDANPRGLRDGTFDVIPSATEQLLYQQSPIVGPANTISAPVGREIASDFTVPSGGQWHVTRVVVLGLEFNQTLTVSVYSDGGGSPGTSVVASTAAALSTSSATFDPCCLDQVYAYNVPITFTVSAGTYWLSELGAFFAEKSPTVGSQLVTGTFSPRQWLSVPGLGANGDIAFYIYGTVETLSEALSGLQTTLTGLGLDPGTLKSFQAKLKAATDALNAGDKATACKSLQDLINAISAVSGKKLTVTQASAVVADVQRIRGLVGC